MNKIKYVILGIIIVVLIGILIFVINSKKKRESAFIYESNGNYGLQDANGKKIIDAKYKRIIKVPNTDTMFIISDDNKYGLLDSNGEEVLKIIYDDVLSDGYGYDYSKIGFIMKLKKLDGYYYGYVDYNGNKVLDVEYESISRICEFNGNDVYLSAMKNGRSGIVKNGSFITELKYQEIFYNEQLKRFIVCKNEKYGMLDENGKELIKPQYKMFGIEENRIYFLDDSKVMYYDTDGKLLEIVEKEKKSGV